MHLKRLHGLGKPKEDKSPQQMTGARNLVERSGQGMVMIVGNLQGEGREESKGLLLVCAPYAALGRLLYTKGRTRS